MVARFHNSEHTRLLSSILTDLTPLLNGSKIALPHRVGSGNA